MRRAIRKVATILLVGVLAVENIPMNVLAAEISPIVGEETLSEMNIDTVSGSEIVGEENVTTGTLGDVTNELGLLEIYFINVL